VNDVFSYNWPMGLDNKRTNPIDLNGMHTSVKLMARLVKFLTYSRVAAMLFDFVEVLSGRNRWHTGEVSEVCYL